MERFNFPDLFLQAWRASISKKLPWLFGSILALVSLAEIHLSNQLPVDLSFEELLMLVSEKDSHAWLSICLFFLALFIISTFGKSNLIASLSFVAGKKNLPNYPNSFGAIRKNFSRAFILESLFFCFLLLAIGIVSLPLIIASSYNREAMQSLVTLGFVTLIPIIILIFFIRQYALFYLILSPLSIRGAIEAGCALFSRFVFPSFLLGLFLYALSTLFTFCLKLVILGIVTLANKASLPIGEVTLSLIIGLAFFSWLAIFQQSLWLAFFKAIATPTKEKGSVQEKDPDFVKNNLPETPPLQ